MKNTAVIILAAGKGKRMKMKNENKVTVSLADKPMIKHIVDFMDKIDIKTIVVVVGFAKKSVINALNGHRVIFAEQKKRLGTGHAVFCALKVLPKDIKDVLIVYGDDAVLYTNKHIHVFKELFEQHRVSGASLTFLTITQDNPTGLGRIVRDSNNKLITIVEEKDATNEQKQIKEINPGCFIFDVKFLWKYLPKLKKSIATGEYYLTSVIDIAIKYNEHIETLQGENMAWRGVNTHEELQKAEELLLETSE